MRDLINREDAIEILSERAESLRGMQGDLGGACRGAMRIIESLPSAEPERKWIPVSERLPEEDMDVLLQFSKNMGVGYYEDGWQIVSGGDLYFGVDDSDEKPIAWMPLPEPWRGDR